MGSPTDPIPKGPTAWMARNPVTSNLIMFFLFFGGIIFSFNINQEVFPPFQLDVVSVRVDYPGAGPEEVEEGVILSIEDQVRSLVGIKKVESIAFEGYGLVTIELLKSANPSKLLQDIKNAVDQIQSFPENAERPIVSYNEPKTAVISLVVYGQTEKRVLWKLAERMREELLLNDGITLVELTGVSPLEIDIEVPRVILREYNLTLDKIASIVRDTALDLPAGGIKTKGGEILLRTQEKRDFASQFEDIPIVSTKEGTELFLGNIATISERFEEEGEEAYFNGVPAVRVDVYRVGSQRPLDIVSKVKAYQKQVDKTLPDGISVADWDDKSEQFSSRMNLLAKNGVMGLLLVMLFLGLFLEPRLAFWVALGIPISVVGSFLVFPFFDATINMMSLFAFIITLGIIVDDAILVGENVYRYREKGMSNLHAAIIGSSEMSVPVTFAILTNIVAFVPLFFVPGVAGKFFFQIPAVVVSVFLISYIESLYVLPSHLAHHHKKNRFWDVLGKPSVYFEKFLKHFIDYVFMPQLRVSLKYRYLTVTLGAALLVVAMAAFVGGHIDFIYLPRVDGEIARANAILPYGIPREESRKIENDLFQGIEKVDANHKGDKLIRGIYTQVGAPLPGVFPVSPAYLVEGSHIVSAQAFLTPPETREITAEQILNEWRQNVGDLPNIESLNFSTDAFGGGGAPIDFMLRHPDQKMRKKAAQQLAHYLTMYEGIEDVDDGVSEGKQQFSFKLKPEAESLGITAVDLANQIRSAFYGAEALRQQRGRNEMKVMVRLPKEERSRLFTVEDLIIRAPSGGEIPLSEAAQKVSDTSYTQIRRMDGQRVTSVTADVDRNVTSASFVISDVKESYMPKLLADYPDLTFTMEGQQKTQANELSYLIKAFSMAMFGVYVLLAIPFRSYTQPILVMLSIPFGVLGATLGHILLGHEMNLLSVIGIIALSGVVINNSLVLIVTINENLKAGAVSVYEATLDAGRRRFRPIMLTSLTTFLGLAPMIFERSEQALFLIPIAISLGFGILFSTFIILLITTSLVVILDDLKSS